MTTGSPASNRGFGLEHGYQRNGSGLLDVGVRAYDPVLGRFLQRDEVEDAAGQPYAYGANSPANLVDPDGRRPTFGDITNLAAGAGDAITFGGTGLIRRWMGVDEVVDRSSGWYVGGEVAGAALVSLAPACFAAGTPVLMGDGTSKAIDQIRAGDLVYTRSDPRSLPTLKHVLRVVERKAESAVVVSLDGGEALEATEEHPFFVEGRGWVRAGELHAGAALASWTGTPARVLGTGRRDGTQPVYNLEVEGFHTYFVGRAQGGVWVHNICWSPDQAALIDLAKIAKRTGASPEEAAILKEWAAELGVLFRGPESHAGRLFGRYPHIHVGPVNHISLR